MQRNTITTLGQLRVGDRFTFLKRVDVWHVTGQLTSKATINQMMPDGRLIHKYDDMKAAKTPVKFLKHTEPVPGEECQVQDLKPGDVFYHPFDVVSEWIVEKYEYPDVYCKSKEGNKNDKVPTMTWGAFEGKSETV